jgi:hypothetical protein
MISARVLLSGGRRERPLLPYAVYRAVLAAWLLARGPGVRR